MAAFSPARNAIVICFTLAVSFTLFRGTIARALVARGDEFLTRGHSRQARTFYARAVALDPSLPLAVDRYAYASLLERTRDSVQQCVEVAGTFIRHHPPDAEVLRDRALCSLVQRHYDAAWIDFNAVWTITHKPNDRLVAEWARRHAARRAQ